jgi:hypothetical protein
MDDLTDILKIFEDRRLPSLLGGDQFISWVKETFFSQKEHKEVPESTVLAPDIQRIKDVVLKVKRRLDPSFLICSFFRKYHKNSLI